MIFSFFNVEYINFIAVDNLLLLNKRKNGIKGEQKNFTRR